MAVVRHRQLKCVASWVPFHKPRRPGCQSDAVKCRHCDEMTHNRGGVCTGCLNNPLYVAQER